MPLEMIIATLKKVFIAEPRSPEANNIETGGSVKSGIPPESLD